MLARLCFACRVAAYALSLSGLFIVVSGMQDAARVSLGRSLVVAGIALCFVSYAMRAVLNSRRRAAWRKAQEERRAILDRGLGDAPDGE